PRWLRKLLRPPLCRRFRHARAVRFRTPPPTAILASRPRGAVGLRPRRARDSLSDRGRPRASVRRDRRSSRGGPGRVYGCGSDGIHRVRVPGLRDMASELAATPRSCLRRPWRWLAGSRFRPGPLHGGARKHEPMDPRPRLDCPPRIRRVRDSRGHPRDPASVRDGGLRPWRLGVRTHEILATLGLLLVRLSAGLAVAGFPRTSIVLAFGGFGALVAMGVSVAVGTLRTVAAISRPAAPNRPAP